MDEVIAGRVDKVIVTYKKRELLSENAQQAQG